MVIAGKGLHRVSIARAYYGVVCEAFKSFEYSTRYALPKMRSKQKLYGTMCRMGMGFCIMQGPLLQVFYMGCRSCEIAREMDSSS